MKLPLFLGILLLLAVITTPFCTREHIQDLSGVCFESKVLPVFQSSCTQSGCHNSQDREAGYDFTTYESIVKNGIQPGDYRKSEVYQVMVAVAGRVPPAPYNRLSDAQLTNVAQWINDGALNTTCVDTMTCNTTDTKYSTAVKPILDTYCNGCHGTATGSGNISYATFSGVKATVTDGTLLQSIEHTGGISPMPQNGNKLSDCNISIIKGWIDAGAPNN